MMASKAVRLSEKEVLNRRESIIGLLEILMFWICLDPIGPVPESYVSLDPAQSDPIRSDSAIVDTPNKNNH